MPENYFLCTPQLSKAEQKKNSKQIWQWFALWLYADVLLKDWPIFAGTGVENVNKEKENLKMQENFHFPFLILDLKLH